MPRSVASGLSLHFSYNTLKCVAGLKRLKLGRFLRVFYVFKVTARSQPHVVDIASIMLQHT